jgi:hypothetical protein
VIGASGDRKSNTEALTADEGGLGKDLPLIHTEDTDLNGEIGKILPQSVGSGGEVYANRSQNTEVQANLG